MATNWEKMARSVDTDSIDAKIGVSTDAETRPTLFGRILGIRNVVDWIKNTWTAAKAGLLDVAVSTRAPAGTALSTATWTTARAGKLDNLDGKISDIGKSMASTSGIKMFTANGTFVVPAGVECIWVTGIAGGGSGGGGIDGAAGGTGGKGHPNNGAYNCYGPGQGRPGGVGGSGGGGGNGGNGMSCFKYLLKVTPGESIQIGIGKGGAAVAKATNGIAGSHTTIGSKLTLVGGGGGYKSSGYATNGQNADYGGSPGTTPAQGTPGASHGLTHFIKYAAVLFQLSTTSQTPSASAAGLVAPTGLFDTFGRGGNGGYGGAGGAGGAGGIAQCGNNDGVYGSAGSAGAPGNPGYKGQDGIVIIEW